MGRTCTLYSFNKRLNSTKQPTGGASFDCLIKHDTDFLHPTLEINASDLSGYNYMSFNGSYFYITSLVSHRTGVWEVTGERDAMATFKTEIGNTNSIIQYNQSNTDAGGSTYRHPDQRIPISRVPDLRSNTSLLTGNFDVSPSVGTFILSAVGEAGGVLTYFVTQSAMAQLISGLGAEMLTRIDNAIGTPQSTTEDILWSSLLAWRQVAKSESSYGNYASLIKSCYWIPFNNFPPGVTKRIYLGDYDTGVDGTCYGTKAITNSLSITIPWSDLADWKRLNCQVQVYLPFCGKVVIPVDKCNHASTVYVYAALDTVGGTLSYMVTCGGYTVEIAGANVAAPYAIGSSNVSLNQFISGVSSIVGGAISAVGGVVSTVTGNPALGVSGVAGGISQVGGGLMQCVSPQVQTVGSMAGISGCGLQLSIEVEVEYFEPIDAASFQAQFGHPVMQRGTPAAGYNQCQGFSVECAGTPQEIATINSYFNYGAYYE